MTEITKPTPAAPRRFTAFVDLLGIREMARTDPETYSNTIQNFQSAIESSCPGEKGPACEIYGFSDSVYCEFSSLRHLLSFLAEVRCKMMLNKPAPVFFRAAIIEGELDAQRHPQTGGKKSEPTITLRKAPGKAAPAVDIPPEKTKLKSAYSFSREAARAFGLQEETKGIGIKLEPKLARDPGAEALVFPNFYFAPGPAQHLVFFSDLRLTREEKSNDMWLAMLRAFYKAKVRSKKYGRYYLSLVANYIQSINFDTLEQQKGSAGIGDDWKPIEILEYFLARKWEKAFRDVSGSDAIYFLLYEKLYAFEPRGGVKKDDIRIRLRHFIARISRLKHEVASIPSDLLTEKGKAAFLADLEQQVFPTRKPH